MMQMQYMIVRFHKNVKLNEIITLEHFNFGMTK